MVIPSLEACYRPEYILGVSFVFKLKPLRLRPHFVDFLNINDVFIMCPRYRFG